MSRRVARAAGVALACAAGLGAPPAVGADGDPPARLADLAVTAGRVLEPAPGRLAIDAAEVRAILPGSNGAGAELRFRYLGATAADRPLASGEARRQIGLKLRVLDDCNLLYVMWRAGPPGLAVQLKRNPGRRTHAQCGAGGYRTLRPRAGTPPPPLAAGGEHVLSAEIVGGVLRVVADGVLAWEGALPEDAASLRGPAGLRSDNGRFELELRARRGPPAAP